MKQRINISISEEAVLLADESGNRSQFIEDLILGNHRVPQSQATGGLTKEEVLDLIKSTISTHGYSTEPVSAIPGVTTGAAFIPKPPDPDKGYPCCSGRTPCKHWLWDDMNTEWKNSITGKTREA